MIEFFVRGTPAPKGSMRAYTIPASKKCGKCGACRVRVRMTPGNEKALEAWVARIQEKAIPAMAGRDLYIDEPLEVTAMFYLSRPKGHFGSKGLRPSAPSLPIVKPDIDKLSRSILDAMTGIVYKDDSRVVDLITRKRYGEREGVEVTVRHVETEREEGGAPEEEDREEGAEQQSLW